MEYGDKILYANKFINSCENITLGYVVHGDIEYIHEIWNKFIGRSGKNLKIRFIYCEEKSKFEVLMLKLRQ